LRKDTIQHTQRTFAGANLLQTCCGRVVYVADLFVVHLLWTSYGETGVRPPVRPSVCDIHVCFSKIISRLISLWYCLEMTPTSAIWSHKLRVEYGLGQSGKKAVLSQGKNVVKVDTHRNLVTPASRSSPCDSTAFFLVIYRIKIKNSRLFCKAAVANTGVITSWYTNHHPSWSRD